MAYSVDFRKKILEAYLKKEGNNQEIANRFKVSISTVKRIGQRFRETGKVELHLDKIGLTSKVNEDGKEILKKIVGARPSATLEEIRDELKERCKIEVTIQAIHYILKELKISYKKKSLYASERDRDDIKKKGKNSLKK